MTTSIGDKIRILRKKSGMTQRELAKEVPTSFSTFRRWENNKHSPTMNELNRLAELLNTSLSYFIEEKENNKLSQKKETSLKEDKGMMTYIFSNGEKIEMPAIIDFIPIFKQIIHERTSQITSNE